jgi:plastocyanin
MRFIARGLATLATAVALAACSGSGQTTTPPVPASQAAGGGQTPGATTAGSAVCADSTGTTTADVAVGDFTWGPVNAKVGDVITWTNSDSVPHRVALDDGSCTMSGNIAQGGGKASLVFSVAGTYPFHCAIHSTMKGTITIS